MGYYDLEDLKKEGVKDLRSLGGTASSWESAFFGYRIRVSDDGDRVFVQNIGESGDGVIEIYDIEEFLCDGEFKFGFSMYGEKYFLDEFLRDDI